MPALDGALLARGFDLLARDDLWSSATLRRFEALIRDGSDDDLFRMNAIVLSRQLELDESTCIDLLLRATGLGLLEMSWQLICPTCAMVVGRHDHLASVHAGYHCAFCQADFVTQLDQYTEVVFSVAAGLRRLIHHQPESLTCEQLYRNHHFNLRARAYDGRALREMLTERTLALEYVEPGSRARWQLPDMPCMIEACDRVHDVGVRIRFDGEGPRAADPRRLALVLEDGKFNFDNLQLAPGPALLELDNRSDRRLAFFMVLFVPGQPILPVTLEPFLTCSRLLTHQSFRRAFKHEVLGALEGLAITDLTVMFSDLSESTAMYARLGDLPAYAQVHQHFARIQPIVEAHAGAVVKTIGDATMTCFTRPGDGLRAALAIHECFAQLERGGPRRLRLKIGLHRGSVIAVTSNGLLDYFGQTVNLAARMQALAEPEQICVTEAFAADPEVAALLPSLRVQAQQSRVRGLSELVDVRIIDCDRDDSP